MATDITSSESISTDALSEQADFNLPQIEPATEMSALGGFIEAQSGAFEQNLKTQAEQAQRGRDDSLESLLTTFASADTQTETRIKAEDKVGLSAIDTELNDINQQIRAEQHAFRRASESIQKESGLTKGQVNQRVGELERKAISKQADLYVIQQGIQGRYDSAKAIADRAVTAMMERQNQELQVAQFIYQENKGLFNKSEQRLFEVQLADRERSIEMEAEQKRSISDLSIEALKNGAPTSLVTAMRESSSVTDALSVGGQYIGLLERQAAGRAAANASLARRKSILELAMMGDKSAIEELGYDPANLPLSQEEIDANEDQYSKNQQDINRINEMMLNTRGLESVSGRIRSPYISGLFSGGKAEGISTLTRFIPVIGNIQGAIQSKNSAESFLTDVNYITKNLTLDKFLELKAQGATFGAMSETEWRIIGEASNELDAMSVKEDGRIVGFRTPEAEVVEQLKLIKRQYKIVQDRLNRVGLNKSDIREIDSLLTQ